ncbi:MAG: hypothetical protein KY428_13055, partial [Bacteroidetes bacterium]|nr:hypothetical protein [Bacteroidota bacterium]
MIQVNNPKDLYLWTEGGYYVAPQLLVEEVSQHISFKLLLKQPGNGARAHALTAAPAGLLQAAQPIPLKITREVKLLPGKPGENGSNVALHIQITAEESAYFSLQGKFAIPEMTYDSSYMYLPGFWYRKNLRSPENTPSERVSKNWIVREDRLSTPLAGID